MIPTLDSVTVCSPHAPRVTAPAARPLVVAHRGASATHPEHTAAAYRAAIDAGADALECDVRLTADGALVCVHDRRLERTSTGRGLVSTSELGALETLCWCSWRAGLPCGSGSCLLTFDALCALVADSGRRVGLSIETKHPVRYGGVVEHRVVGVLARHGWAGGRTAAGAPVRVMSFAPSALRRVHRLAPGLETVQLVDRLGPRLGGTLPPGVPVVGPDIRLLRRDQGYVARVHDRGGRVHVWTVNGPDDVDLCLRLGVDGIITDSPAAVRAAVDAHLPA